MSNLLTAKELKERGSIVELLSRLGYQPVPKRGREKMYVSMLRKDDTDPSFSVNDELGVWFDHGTGKGGNIIDFGLAYWKHLGFNEVVRKLQDTCQIEPGAATAIRPEKKARVPYHVVEQVKPLGTHPAITTYLKTRGIFETAKKCLREVYYYLEDDEGVRKHFFAAGWQNESSGWEVRNKFFKGCIGRKDVTVIRGHEKKAAIFEGFIDYLSWRFENPGADHSIIVLNTITMLTRGVEKAKAYSSIDIYFDRDKQGFLATKEFLKSLPYATDRSKAYEGYNDYNDKIKAQLNEAVVDERKTSEFFSGIKVPFER
jgi:DNA primase